MAAPRYGPPASPSGERWNVNMPAVIGVIFVFLLGVVVWVIASGGSDDGDDGDDGAAGAGDEMSDGSAAAPPITQDVAAPGTTSPAPMPSTTALVVSSDTSTTSTVEAPEVTAAPGAGPDAVPGDLAIAGRPMQRPPCDDAYITVLASAVGDQATATGIAEVLETYPGSNYLRTDQTCTSLNPDIDGEPIYVVFLGPFAFDTDACAARAEGPEGAYARVLSNDVGPDHAVPCG